jgi:hypothetical protein
VIDDRVYLVIEFELLKHHLDLPVTTLDLVHEQFKSESHLVLLILCEGVTTQLLITYQGGYLLDGVFLNMSPMIHLLKQMLDYISIIYCYGLKAIKWRRVEETHHYHTQTTEAIQCGDLADFYLTTDHSDVPCVLTILLTRSQILTLHIFTHL